MDFGLLSLDAVLILGATTIASFAKKEGVTLRAQSVVMISVQLPPHCRFRLALEVLLKLQ